METLVDQHVERVAYRNYIHEGNRLNSRSTSYH